MSQTPLIPLYLLPIPVLLAGGNLLAGQLDVDRAVIDFGIVGLHARAQTVVTVTNGTDRAVRLHRPDSDCICLTSAVEKELLAPGESCAWRIELATCDYTGDVQRSVWLETDDPSHPRLSVAVHYEVRPPLYVEAPFVSVGLLGGGTVEIPIAIHTTASQPVQILGVSEYPNASVGILNPVVSPDRPGTLRVFCSPGLPGPWRATIRVRTDSQEMPLLEIPLLGETAYGLRGDRPELNFGRVELGRTAEQAVTFTPEAGVTIGEVRLSNDSVQIQALERTDGRVRVALRSNERLPLGSFNGFLILEVTGQDERRKVRLPYRGRVVGPAAVSSARADLKEP